MKRKRVIILGASRYYMKSIEAAQRAGYDVIAVDKNPDSEGFTVASEYRVCDIVDKEGLLQIARESGVSGIVPVNDYGVPTAAYVSSQLGLPGIDETTARYATIKEEMRRRWLETGMPCPRYEMGHSPDEIMAAARRVGFPCILKPAHGIGGASRGIVVVHKEEEMEKAVRFSHAFYEDKATLVESFVDAEYEHSAEVLVHNGKAHVIAISDKVKSPLPYRVDKSVLYPTAVTGKRRKELVEMIKSAVKALGIGVGAAHVELATTRNGFVLFELGARCGGGGTPEPIVPFVTGVDLFTELVRILCDDEPVNLVPLWEKGCSYHFITLKPGTLRSISNFDQIQSAAGVLDAEMIVKPGQTVLPVTVGTERSGFIICGAEERETAYSRGVELENSIVAEYEEWI